MTPPPGDPNEGGDPGIVPAPKPLSYAELDTRQMVYEMGSKIDVLINEVRRLVEDRKSDREQSQRDLDKVETNLRRDLTAVSDDLKDFREKSFEPLRNDVSGLRLKWAWVTGLAAAIGAGLGLVGEIVIEFVKLSLEHGAK